MPTNAGLPKFKKVQQFRDKADVAEIAMHRAPPRLQFDVTAEEFFF